MTERQFPTSLGSKRLYRSAAHNSANGAKRGLDLPGPINQSWSRPALAFGTFALAIFGFALSKWLMESYVYGDLIHYRDFWRRTEGAPLDILFDVQRSMTGSGEPMYGLFSYLASPLGHDPVVILVNTVFMIVLAALCAKYGVPWWLVPLLAINYYVIVLLGPAERLKFGILMIGFGLLFEGRWRVVLLASAPFWHLQSVLFLIPVLVAGLFSEKSGRYAMISTRRKLMLGFLVGALTVAIAYVAGDVITHKAQGYSERAGFPMQALGLYAAGLFFFWDRPTRLLALTVLMGATFLFGEFRMNIVIVFTLIGYFLVDRRHTHPFLLLLLAYLVAKSLQFIQTIDQFGTGWPNPTEYSRGRF